jgi:hypothetical protein
VAKENAATAALQVQAEKDRLQAAAKTCGNASAYWQSQHDSAVRAFDMDACMSNPGAAERAVNDDKQARMQAAYQQQLEQHKQQQAEYARHLAEYERQKAEFEAARQAQAQQTSPVQR